MGVIGKNRARRAEFRAHVRDRRFAGRGKGIRARTEVFNNGVRAAFDGENPEELQDDILRSGPALQLSGELHADHLRHRELPLHTRHAVHGVRAADTDRDAAKPRAIRRVRVAAHNEAARIRVVFECLLMNNARARFPEVDTELIAHVAQELVGHAVIVV